MLLASQPQTKMLNIAINSYCKASGQKTDAYKATLYTALGIVSSYELSSSKIHKLICEILARTDFIKILQFLAQVILGFFSKAKVLGQPVLSVNIVFFYFTDSSKLAFYQLFPKKFQIKNPHPPPNIIGLHNIKNKYRSQILV